MSLVDEFAELPPAMRKLFLAQLATDITSDEQREVHRVLSDLHQTLSEIRGDDE
jgi:hypothetical protein